MMVGHKLKEQRLKQKETQESLALKLGVSRQTISNWENGKTLPDIDSLIKIAQLYQLSMDELFELKPEAPIKHSKYFTTTITRNVIFLAILLLLMLINVGSVFLFILLLIGLTISYMLSDFSQFKHER